MLKKMFIAIAVLAVCAAAFIGCKKQTDSTAAAGDDEKAAKPAQVITLTYANFPPASTFPCVQMERWKDEVQKRTQGRVEIKTFPGGTLLEAKAMMDGVINGQADIGCLCMAYQPGRFNVTNATSLPLGIPDAKVGSQVLWDLYQKYQPAEFKDVKVITMFATAPSNIMSRKPIRTLDDIKGMDLRGSGGASDILKAWSANNIGMPMSNVPEALQKGVLQGLFSSLEAMQDFNYAELCRYVTLTDTCIYPFAVVMNRAKWESLPEDVQKVIDDMALEQCLWTGDYMDKHVQESIEWSKATYQVEFIELSAADKAKWNALLEPIVLQWITDQNTDGLPGQEIIDFLKAAIAKYAPAAK